MGNVARMAGACTVPNIYESAVIPFADGPVATEVETDSSVAWFALIVHQYKRELCEQVLASRGYEYFSPSFLTVKIWSDRCMNVDVPLFPGYIFCRFNPEKRLALLQIPGVLGIVSSGKQFLEVDAAEIEAIRIAIASKLPVEPCRSLMPGEKVKVVQGPLRGVTGVLVRTKGESRLLLSVAMLNRHVSVEVDVCQLAVEDRAADRPEVQ